MSSHGSRRTDAARLRPSVLVAEVHMRWARKGPRTGAKGVSCRPSPPPFQHCQAVEVAPPALPLRHLAAEDHQDDEDQERQLAVDYVKEST